MPERFGSNANSHGPSENAMNKVSLPCLPKVVQRRPCMQLSVSVP